MMISVSIGPVYWENLQALPILTPPVLSTEVPLVVDNICSEYLPLPIAAGTEKTSAGPVKSISWKGDAMTNAMTRGGLGIIA